MTDIDELKKPNGMTDIKYLTIIAESLGARIEDFGDIVWIAGREYKINEAGEIIEVSEEGING